MSAFLMVELTIRSVDSLRSSLARIASLTALLMSSRSMFFPLKFSGSDLGRSVRQNNSKAGAFSSREPVSTSLENALCLQPFDQCRRGRLRLLQLRHVPAIGQDHQFGVGDVAGHLHR